MLVAYFNFSIFCRVLLEKVRIQIMFVADFYFAILFKFTMQQKYWRRKEGVNYKKEIVCMHQQLN
jgi:hypothetical protein